MATTRPGAVTRVGGGDHVGASAGGGAATSDAWARSLCGRRESVVGDHSLSVGSWKVPAACCADCWPSGTYMRAESTRWGPQLKPQVTERHMPWARHKHGRQQPLGRGVAGHKDWRNHNNTMRTSSFALALPPELPSELSPNAEPRTRSAERRDDLTGANSLDRCWRFAAGYAPFTLGGAAGGLPLLLGPAAHVRPASKARPGRTVCISSVSCAFFFLKR